MISSSGGGACWDGKGALAEDALLQWLAPIRVKAVVRPMALLTVPSPIFGVDGRVGAVVPPARVLPPSPAVVVDGRDDGVVPSARTRPPSRNACGLSVEKIRMEW